MTLPQFDPAFVAMCVQVQEEIDQYVERELGNLPPHILVSALTYEIGAIIVRAGSLPGTRAETEQLVNMVTGILRLQVQAGAE